MHPTVNALALVAALSIAAQNPAPTTLKCEGSESVLLRAAPKGTARVAKGRLAVAWAKGTKVLKDSGTAEGYMDGVSYEYCAFDPVGHLHLIHKHDGAQFSGILLDHTTGKVIPGGLEVQFAPDRSRYFATAQPDGLDGEEWFVYSAAGAKLWKGVSGITAKHPKLKYDYFIATLSAPRWSPSGELEAQLTCTQGTRSPTTVKLLKVGGGYAWQPSVTCPPGS